MRQSVATPPTKAPTSSPSSSSSSSAGCFICKSTVENELLLGKLHKKWRLRVHYHCLLLTSNLVQTGEEDEGIFGFMEEDIRNEEARIRGQKCYICKERYANIWCCAKKCFRTFHTYCGMQNNCLSHYVDTFQSWCDKHVMLEDKVKHSETEPCGICYDEMGPYLKLDSIRAPCCQNGWFHRNCVAQFAQSAGYFFKCPLCNNKDDFSKQMQQRGVYIPEKDASWELEPNAFDDQLERPSACDAEECRCRYGRDYDDCKRWDLILCATCGSTCRHDQCMEVPSKNYVCSFCRPFIGDKPPEAVLELAEASRRAEAARRAEEARERARGKMQINSDSDSDADSSQSSESSEIIKNKKRKNKNRRTVIDSDGSDSDLVSKRKKPASKRRLSSTSSGSSSVVSSSSEELSLEELLKKIPLPRGTSVEKLLRSKPVVKIEKLSSEKIKTLTSSENEEEASSAGSSTVFDFNYRVKLNKKQRRKSMVELQQSIKEVIRSDTDTLTDASAGNHEIRPPKTPAQSSFAKKFKLKLLGSKTVPRKRSTSESDAEHVPAKKSRPSMDQKTPVSKSRVALFPLNDEENTCPNSPMKASIEPISHAVVVVDDSVSPISSSPVAPKPIQRQPLFPPTPPTSSSSSSNSSSKPAATGGGAHHQQQKTLNYFFKKTPPAEDEQPTAASSCPAGADSGNSGNAIASNTTKPSGSAKKRLVGKTPKGMRKKLVELDRSQRNLLDYFNRC